MKCLEEIITEEGEKCGWTESDVKQEIIAQNKYICGIEKDPFLTKLSKSYMAVLGDGLGGIFREDSLDLPSHWNSITQQHIKLGTFDFLLANPPFGENIKVEGKEKLSQYTLASKTGEKGKNLLKTGIVSSLFLERNLQLLKSGGKLAIILPEPYFVNDKYKAAIDLIIKGNNIEWIIDLPQRVVS